MTTPIGRDCTRQPCLGPITVPHLNRETGETLEFTSDGPDDGLVFPTLPAYRLYHDCPDCGGSLWRTRRTLTPPEGAFCPPVVLLFDECGNPECEWRKPL